jgi:hypothetical protein
MQTKNPGWNPVSVPTRDESDVLRHARPRPRA